MMRIGIIGPESTGKTTLAKELAERYQGIYVPEYAREFVEKKGSTEVTWDELCEIAKRQIERLAIRDEGLVVFDTELIITKVWFDYAFGRWPEWLDEAIKQYPMDVYVILYPDLPWVPDPARSNGSDEIRMELFERYKQEVEALGIEHYLVKHN
jgi:NadR type nicotinamide-nucleotide adenylyltransferase